MKAYNLTNGQIQYVVCSFRLRLAVLVRSRNACGIFAERVFLFWSCFNIYSAQDLENKTWIQPFLERDSSGNPRHNTSRITPEKRCCQSACLHEFETVTCNNKSELCPTDNMWVEKSHPLPPLGNRRKFILWFPKQRMTFNRKLWHVKAKIKSHDGIKQNPCEEQARPHPWTYPFPVQSY